MMGIQFIMNMSFTMTSPIMPLFLPQLGLHTDSEVNTWSGLIGGSTSFIAALASPIWGRMADRTGRKISLMRAGTAIAIFTILIGISTSVWELFTFRTLMGAFAGFSSAAIALVASQVPEERLGFALGWLADGQIIGSLVGPIFGGLLADATGSYRLPFFLTGAIMAACLALIWFYVPEQFTPSKQRGGQRSLLSSLSMLTRAPGLLSVFFVLLMAQFAVRSIDPVVSLFVKEMVGEPANLATLAGVALSITGLSNLLSSPFLGKRSDKIGYRKVLLICLAGTLVTCVPQFFVHDYWNFVGERFAIGLFIGGIVPTANAMVGRLVAPTERGTAYGVTSSAMFLGGSLGPLTGGLVAGAWGIRWVFLVTSAFLLANLLWVWFTVPRRTDHA